VRFKSVVLALLIAGGAVGRARAQADLPLELRSRMDAAIRETVAATGVPSAEVGVVRDGRVVFAAAYGDARLRPEQKAEAGMAYPVGSITKQFTAACVLLLAEDGKLTLDDPVARWFPGLTRAKDVTVRELLSHTSGYEDYAPQDYTIPLWMKPTDPAKLVADWAGKPLDFEPGTQWQYSNTNFVLAALIVEKASGRPFFEFLRERVLQPLGLKEALDLDTERDKLQVEGYERRALAPLRPAVLEAPGWYFGDGNLAMPVADLLNWDVSVMDRTLLKAGSYDAMETAVKLKDGKATTYGLGLEILKHKGDVVLEHSGEVGGFVAENIVFPKEKIAIAVLTNQEASSAAEKIASAIAKLMLHEEPAVRVVAPEETQMKAILTALQDGKIDRGLFTADANYYFSADTLGDFASSLKPLGTITSVAKTSESLRGGMTERSFSVAFSRGRSVSVSTYTMADGRLEQLLVEGNKE
jgi:CubicO group peptidase (beta-lactamase class C family)